MAEEQPTTIEPVATQTPIAPVAAPAVQAAYAAAPDGSKSRGGCLTAWLVLGFLGGVASIIGYATGSSNEALAQAYGNWPSWANPAYIVFALINLASIYGIWTWKKWGLNLYYAMLIVNIVLVMAVGGPWIFGIIGAAIGAGLMYWLTNSKHEQFV